MSQFVLSVLLIFAGITATCSKKSNKSLLYTKMELAHNPFYMKSFKGNLSADQTTWNLEAHVARNLTEDLWLQILVASWQPSTSTYRNRLRYDLNVYDLLRKGMNDKFNILYIWLNNFWKFGTLPMRVPFMQGIYYWRGIKTDRSSIPAYIFHGLYRMDVITYFMPKNAGKFRDGFMNLTFCFKIQ